jgi:hypothetical protein
MAGVNTKDDFEVYDILSTEQSGNNKTIMHRVGDIFSTADTAGAEDWSGTWGYSSRPSISDPKSGEPAAQAFAYNTDGNRIILGFRDMRHQYKYGNLLPGDNSMWCGGQGRILLKNTGDVALMTAKGNTDDGTGCTIQLLASGAINLASEFGGISLQENDLTLMSAKGSGAIFNSDGATISGQTIALNGKVNLGSITATGVATQMTLTQQDAAVKALAISLTTLATALGTLGAAAAAVTPVTVSTLNPGGSAVVAAAAAVGIASGLLTGIVGLPTNYSSTVSASA